jgi:peptidoglycan/LPS O-acetylase OafA/YrhL
MDAPAQYRADIDGLRAIAVVLVLGFHAFPGRVPGGFVGVDVFFVISGYLITGLILRELQQDRFSVARFYARRIRRIFPALAVLLVACLAAAAPLLGPSAYAQLGLHAAAGAAFVANLVLWAQSGYFAAGSDSLPLLHLWSLGVEEQFYLAWPLTLAVLFRRTRRLWVPLALIAAASLALNLYQVRASPDTAFYSPLTRFWELMTGALLAVGAERRLAPALRAAMSLGGVALVLVAALAFDGSQEFPGWRAVVPVSGTALSIAAGSEAWLNRRLLSLRAPVFVGLISYPLYLWHWPALSLLPLLDVAWTQRQELLLKLAALALASLLAWLTYRFVERPVRIEKKGSTGALCAAMAVPLVAGLLVARDSRSRPGNGSSRPGWRTSSAAGRTSTGTGAARSPRTRTRRSSRPSAFQLRGRRPVRRRCSGATRTRSSLLPACARGATPRRSPRSRPRAARRSSATRPAAARTAEASTASCSTG